MFELLARMAAASRDRVREAKSRVTEVELLRRAGDRPTPKGLLLSREGFDVIGEIKLRSPSSGRLGRGSRDAAGRAAAYERGGAAAVSVVTEPSAFGGSLGLLSSVTAACRLPTMRKDFLIDPYQLVEAKAHGAAGVLLIARLLDPPLLLELIATAASLELFVLLEAFDRADLDRARDALTASAAMAFLGVNARDLRTLAVDRSQHAALARAAPATLPLIAESGVKTPGDAANLAASGYRAALVGESLMAEEDPRPLLEALIASGRQAIAPPEVTR